MQGVYMFGPAFKKLINYETEKLGSTLTVDICKVKIIIVQSS